MEISKVLTQWYLVPLWPIIKNKYFTNMKIKPRLLILNTKIFKVCTQWYFVPLGLTLLLTTKILSKNRQQQKMTFFGKYLDHSQNNCEGLTQWDFVPLGPIIT